MPYKPIIGIPGPPGSTAVNDDDSGGVPGAHAPTHTDGTDQVADATFLLSGLIQGAEKEKLSSLATAVGAGAGDQLIANGGGGSIWTPPVIAMREMFTVSATDPKAQYTNIHAAVLAAVAAGASSTHWFLVMVFPGIYSEAHTHVPAGVVVAAVETIRSQIVDVRAANNLDDLFVMEGGSLINLNISGVSDPLHACVRGSTLGVLCTVAQCRFHNCSNAVWAEAGAAFLIPNLTVNIDGGGQAVDRVLFADGAGTQVVGSQIGVFVPNVPALLALYPGSDPVRRAIHVENGAHVDLSQVSLPIAHNTANQAAIEAGAGAILHLFTLALQTSHVGVLINAGVGATLVSIIGGAIDSCDTNWDIQSAAATLFFNGTIDDHSKRSLVAGAGECSVMQETSTESTETFGPFNLEYLTDRTIELTQFVSERHSSVVGLGGVTIADEGGLDISITAGKGWIHRPAAPYEDAEDVSWGHEHHTLDDDSTSYIYLDATTGLIAHGIVAPGPTDLLLFQVLTVGGDIICMQAVWTNGVDRCKLLEDYLRSTRRVMLNTGLGATINADPHYWDLGGGSYYYGLLLETLTGGAKYPFTYYYGAGGASTLAPAGGNHVDLLQYDNAGALAAMGAGEYRSDTLFVTSCGKASIILGATSNALQATAVAEAAAAAPLFLYPTVFVVAKLIVQQGAGVVQVIDLRTVATTTVAPGAADHNLLANLTAPNDAHCFSSDTELLTADGWKTYDKIKKDEVAATLNLSTGAVEFQRIRGKFVYDTFDKMVHIHSRSVDLLVTPEHRIVCKPFTRCEKKPWLIKEANELLTTGAFVVPRCGNEARLVTGKEPLFALLGIVVSEGGICDPKKSGYGIKLYQAETNAGWVQKIVDDAGAPHSIYTHLDAGRRVGTTKYVTKANSRIWYIRSAWSRKHLRPYLDGKTLSALAMNEITASEFDAFLSAACDGDGTKYTDKKWYYCSKNKKIIDQIQALAVRFGLSTVSWRRSGVPREMWDVSITWRKHSKINHVDEVDYSGDVWCVSVPNGTLVIRRNGKVAIAGNTNYMNLSGVRPMGGDLAMGGNAIVNVGNVDGVDVSAHNARHQPGGIDAIALGLPTPIQVGDAQAAGGAASLANSAHVHAVTAAVPVAVGTANAIGAAATSVHSDHVHAGLTRGAADFTVFPVKAAPIPADVVLIEDSAAAGVKKYTTAGAVAALAPGGVFGANYQTAISLARTTTNAAAYVTKVSLVTPALTGTYRVSWECVGDAETVNKAINCRLFNATDAAIVGAAVQDRFSTATGRHPYAQFAEVVFAGVAKTFQLQFMAPDAPPASVVGCQNARIELWRVA